jgi:queuine/archaeosine tRNA-ribosyltransferase
LRAVPVHGSGHRPAAACLHHLDCCNEILSSRLNTIHKLRDYQNHMRNIREAIEQDRYAEFAAASPQLRPFTSSRPARAVSRRRRTLPRPTPA